MTLPGLSGGKIALIGFLATLLGCGVAGTVGYLKGRSDGYAIRVAADEAGQKAALRDLERASEKALQDQARQILDDTRVRLTMIDAVAAKLKAQQETLDANAQSLAAALRGRFVLSPSERLRFECIRRPDDARCKTNTLHAAVP